jgi:ribonuclease BN (tRNA processing enzyme)
MHVRVLGCSGAIAAGCKTTAFLLDDDVLVDAGTGVGDLSLEELTRIDHILLSHSHLDHILSIPLLADSVLRARVNEHANRPIHVHALPQTLDALRTHLFNGVLWPDFTRLPSPQKPILVFHPLAVHEQLTLGGKLIEVLPAAHTVPAVGFAASAPSGWWVYTGDTGPNPDLWRSVNGRRVAALVIETAFSDEEQGLAQISGHLSPGTLASELAQLDGSIPVYITHTKPGEMAAVLDQIRAIDTRHRIEPLVSGQRFEF